MELIINGKKGNYPDGQNALDILAGWTGTSKERAGRQVEWRSHRTGRTHS